MIQLGQKIESNKSCFVTLADSPYTSYQLDSLRKLHEEDDFDWTESIARAKENLAKQHAALVS